MTQPSTVVMQQAEALIQMLRNDAAADCARQKDQAATRAHALLHAAYSDSRRLMREAIQEERNRRDNALSQTRAGLATRRRQQVQRDASQVVRASWSCLPRVLQSMWNDPLQRLAWCHAAIASAARVLRPERWEITCPAVLTPTETVGLSERTGALGVHETFIKPDSALTAGIVIRSAGAVFDASTVGLLTNQAAIEAELHAVWLAESAA